jgi:gliding motility-associated-like protein
MRKTALIFILLCSLALSGFATHNRAGEITYKQLSGLTYQFTITTFTFSLSAADRDQLEVQWGDNTTSIAQRISKVLLPNNYFHNIYVINHTFPGPGIYEVVVEDPNRNFGVLNIPNSVNVVFSIKTTLLVNPDIGINSTPLLLNPPIDKAALGYIFIHNPAAFDPDGDSISYKLTICTTSGGEPIENYSFPDASDSLYVDPISGDLVWNTPIDSGIYNIAIDIEEWRNGVKIGNILRDMQVDVYRTDNEPPQNPLLDDRCIEAGTFIDFIVTSTDPNNDLVTHWDTGGVYQVSGALPTFTEVDADSGYVTSRFQWQTECSHVRNSPYNWLLKAEDNNRDVSLVDIDNANFKIMGPAPENLVTTPTSNAIRLQWSDCRCENVTGYQIYRKVGTAGFVPDSCEHGVPGYTGYKQVGATTSGDDTTFVDSNMGEGLLQGTEYCYMVVAVFPDGSTGYASEEVCGVLVQGTPIITNVSVTNTDPTNGSIFLAWLKPDNLDTIPALGPYEYRIYQSEGIWGEDFSLIHTFTTADLEDTTYTVTNLNTLEKSYTFKVELYNDEAGNEFLIGSPGIASSLFLTLGLSDNQIKIHFNKNVPWVNTDYTVFRQDLVTFLFDSIGFTTDSMYVDSNLINGVEYCYLVESSGTFAKAGLPSPLLNLSQEACGIPVDTEPPCPPRLEVVSFCDSFYNELTWSNIDPICSEDVVQYNVYHTGQYNSPLIQIGSTGTRDDTTFTHYPDLSMAGCYAITAVDSFANESAFSQRICIDNCTFFELPNVFTPNGDGVNDFLVPKVYKFVKEVGIKIYNRNGTLVFEEKFTDPLAFSWDGKVRGSDKIATAGVYYYVCDIMEERLTGLESRNIVGFVHVITERNPKQSGEK